MSVIVGIHGIGAQYTGGPKLSADWLLALRGGMEAAGFRAEADALTEDDIRVAHFGNLFRPPGTMSGGEPGADVRDLEQVDADLLDAFTDAALAKEPGLGAPDGSMGPARRGLNTMITTLLRSKTFAAVTQRMFLGDLRQVNKFLDDAATKQLVLDHVREEIAPDTRILLAHSLGTVVAYEYLCADRPASIELLVTFGSPLGMPNLVFDRLTPRPSGDHDGVWPGAVKRWVNVAAEDDIVAVRGDLAPLFPPPAGLDPVRDRQVNNGGSPHEAERYLGSEQVGESVGTALR